MYHKIYWLINIHVQCPTFEFPYKIYAAQYSTSTYIQFRNRIAVTFLPPDGRGGKHDTQMKYRHDNDIYEAETEVRRRTYLVDLDAEDGSVNLYKYMGGVDYFSNCSDRENLNGPLIFILSSAVTRIVHLLHSKYHVCNIGPLGIYIGIHLARALFA